MLLLFDGNVQISMPWMRHEHIHEAYRDVSVGKPQPYQGHT